VGSLLNKLSRAISLGLVGIAAVTLVAWVFTIVVFVVSRALFNVEWMFVEEYTGYCMVLLTSFSLSYALRKGAHINVNVVSEIIPKKMQKPLKVFADFVGLVVAIYLTWHGTRWLMHGLEGGGRSWFPSRTLLWPVYALVPIGLSALSLEFLNQLVMSIGRLRQGETPEE